MSSIDHNKSEDSPSLCNLARIDTSNDWSDMESLGSHSGPHLLSQRKSRSIEVIPSTPSGESQSFFSDDAVASLREMDSLVEPSSAESEDPDPFGSFVISVTNLDLEGTQTDEWETTLHSNNNNTTTAGTAPSKPHAPEDRPSIQDNKTNVVPPKVPTQNKTQRDANTSLKPIIRPRLPIVSAFDKENNLVGSSHNNRIPLRRSTGHRRVSFNSLPSPKDLEAEGVEMSFTTARVNKEQQKKKRTKKKWSHRRPKVLNATTAFR